MLSTESQRGIRLCIGFDTGVQKLQKELKSFPRRKCVMINRLQNIQI